MKGDKTRRGVRFDPAQIEWLENEKDRTGRDGSWVIRNTLGQPVHQGERSNDVENLTRKGRPPSGTMSTTQVDLPKSAVTLVGRSTETPGREPSVEPSTIPIYTQVAASPIPTAAEIPMKMIEIPIVATVSESSTPINRSAIGPFSQRPGSSPRFRSVPTAEGKFPRLLAQVRRDLESERGALQRVTQERDRALRELVELHRQHDDLLRKVDAQRSAIAAVRHRRPRVEADSSGRAVVVVPTKAKDLSGRRVVVRQRLRGFRLDR